MAVSARRLAALRIIAWLAVWLSAAVGLLGCAGPRPSPTVIDVGRASITKRSVDHWASIITRGAIVANVADPQQSPRRQALALLIYLHWLIGEASRVDLHLSQGQLERMVEQQERSMPAGRHEFLELLDASGEASADVEFETRARWAAHALAGELTIEVERTAKGRVSSDTILRFYRAHAARYHLRERRFYDLVERIPSRAAAVALAKQLGTGRHFSERSSKERPYRPRTFAGLPGQATVYRAVFRAKVGVLTGPLPLQGAYALFVLRRIEPARVQPLAEVRGAIERQLLASAERSVRAQLISEFRARWTSQTDCRPGYVVQKCRQYTGSRVSQKEPRASF
jgi:hypothetical protein